MLRLTIGMLGCGVVGGGVASRLIESPRLSGIPIDLRAILVRDPRKPRFPEAARSHLTVDPRDVLADPEVDVVVEAIGGIEPARTYIEAALRARKHVVTANKALIAEHGPALSQIAQQHRVALRYEAAVAGAIPIVRTLADLLSAEDVLEVSGIFNGTSNFVVGRMRAGESIEDAIASAQRAGYAEADPSDDVDGLDAARKLAILAPLAFGARVRAESIPRRSLRRLRTGDVAFARSLGCVVTPVAVLRRNGASLEAAVTPALVPESHAFAAADGPENVVRITGAHCGVLHFAGHGAGRSATASAVLSDLAEIARRRAAWQSQAVAALDLRHVSPVEPEWFRTASGGLPRFDSEQYLEAVRG